MAIIQGKKSIGWRSSMLHPGVASPPSQQQQQQQQILLKNRR